MNISRKTKKIIICITYIIAIIIQFFAFTPYIKTETYISSQNVPHIVVIERGYTSFEKADGPVFKGENEVTTRQQINHSLFTFQLILTTVFAALAYYFWRNKKAAVSDSKVLANCEKCEKSKNKPFINKRWTFFSMLIIFVLLATNIYTLYNYYIMSTELDKSFTKFNELNKVYLEQKSNYEGLKEQHRILTTENKKLSQKYSSAVASNESLSESYSNLKSDYDNLQVEQKETTKKYIDLQNDTKKCAMESCDNDAGKNSLYCYRHECSSAGCHEKRDNIFCHYCINHKCSIPNCNWGQAYNSIYCLSHKQ